MQRIETMWAGAMIVGTMLGLSGCASAECEGGVPRAIELEAALNQPDITAAAGPADRFLETIGSSEDVDTQITVDHVRRMRGLIDRAQAPTTDVEERDGIVAGLDSQSRLTISSLQSFRQRCE